MTHLSDIEIVDFLEDALPAARAAHLETCEACGRRARDARRALARAIEADMPEPSPLFWQRFSDRVRQAISETPAGASSGWPRWLDHGGLRWALSGAIVLALVVSAAWRVMAPTMPHSVAPSRPSAGVRPTDSTAAAALDDVNADVDPAWAVVRTLADEVTWSDSVEIGLAARPDAADRVAATLTLAERSELLRLLQAEIK